MTKVKSLFNEPMALPRLLTHLLHFRVSFVALVKLDLMRTAITQCFANKSGSDTKCSITAWQTGGRVIQYYDARNDRDVTLFRERKAFVFGAKVVGHI